MPKDTGYEPGPRSGLSSGKRAFPENVEPRGAKRFGPQPYTPRPPKRNIFNVDRHGRVQPRGPRS